MDEAKWLACTEPERMLGLLARTVSNRKRRLFTCACVRRAWERCDDERGRKWVEATERIVDGLAAEGDFAAVTEGTVEIRSPIIGTFYAESQPGASPYVAGGSPVAPNTVVCMLEELKIFNEIPAECSGIIVEALANNASFIEYGSVLFRVIPTASAEDASCERSARLALVCDIFGNTFRPASLEPTWRTADVLALAQAAYEQRSLPSGALDSAVLAVLGDALEEAGCTGPILDHLRGPGPHVRGCHALDAILARE